MESKMNKNRRLLNVGLILLVLIVAYVYQLAFTVHVGFSVQNGTMQITTPSDEVYTIYNEQILSIELMEGLDYGEPLDSQTTGGVQYGTWSNSLWKSYFLCVSQKIDTCIAITTSDEVVVFNYESEDATRSLYIAINQVLAEPTEQ